MIFKIGCTQVAYVTKLRTLDGKLDRATMIKGGCTNFVQKINLRFLISIYKDGTNLQA